MGVRLPVALTTIPTLTPAAATVDGGPLGGPDVATDRGRV